MTSIPFADSSSPSSSSPSSSPPSSGPASSDLSSGLSNVPPADELYAVRAQIKELTEREKVLRQLMLSDPSARTGNKYLVEIVDVAVERTDWKELKAHRPEIADIIAEYTFTTTQKRVELRSLTEDGEITRIRRKQP